MPHVLRSAMRLRAHRRVVSDDCAVVAAALAGAGYVDDFAGGEQINLDFVADFQVCHFRTADFANETLRCGRCLGSMTLFSFIGTLFAQIFKSS